MANVPAGTLWKSFTPRLGSRKPVVAEVEGWLSRRAKLRIEDEKYFRVHSLADTYWSHLLISDFGQYIQPTYPPKAEAATNIASRTFLAEYLDQSSPRRSLASR
jgi:hypothetical protein